MSLKKWIEEDFNRMWNFPNFDDVDEWERKDRIISRIHPSRVRNLTSYRIKKQKTKK